MASLYARDADRRRLAQQGAAKTLEATCAREQKREIREMSWLRAAVVIAATLISSSALSASANSMPRGLQKAADCMYGILKKEPGFEKAKLGVAEDTAGQDRKSVV